METLGGLLTGQYCTKKIKQNNKKKRNGGIKVKTKGEGEFISRKHQHRKLKINCQSSGLVKIFSVMNVS